MVLTNKVKCVLRFFLIFLFCYSCNSEIESFLPLDDNNDLLRKVDSVLFDSGISNKEYAHVNIKMQNQYRLIGHVNKNGSKEGWWKFIGKKDSLIFEIIDMGEEEFINQNIYYENGKIVRDLSKYLKIKKKIYNDSLHYHFDYYVPFIINDTINNPQLTYAIAPNENSYSRQEIRGEIKEGRLQFNFMVDYNKYKDSIIVISPSQSFVMENGNGEKELVILQSFVTDTIKLN